MFSNRQEDDHLYDFNTSLGAMPGSGAFKAPSTAAYRGGTAAGRPLVSSMGGGKGIGANANRASASRMGTAGQGSDALDARPMTSVSGAGYKGGAFDPLNQQARGPAPALAEKSDNSPEDKAKELEKGVHKLIEESAQFIVDKEFQKALEKAKEAGKAERALCKFRESNSLMDHINLDLTYAICFNLANAYYHNKLYDDALKTYQLIVKNKNYPQSGRLRVNMGIVYYEQKQYFQAIKMFRMALDQIPATSKELRMKIMRNIGNAFVKLGQFQDAIDSFDGVMQSSPDIQASYNLLLCYYAHGDTEKIKRHFTKMLSVPIAGMTEDDDEKIRSAADGHLGGGSLSGALSGADSADAGSSRIDMLREDLSKKAELFNDRLLVASRLIAPVVGEVQSDGLGGGLLSGSSGSSSSSGSRSKGEDWVGGYSWVMEQLKPDKDIVASKLEIDLAMEYMKRRKFDDAIDVLKSFEKKDPSLRAMASTNLSCIYFLEGDYANAEKQADVAIKSDRYNAKALVNKGNCLFVNREFAKAREMYLEAVGVEADCIEAIYNLGLVNIEMNVLDEAKNAFDKLHTILPTVPEALFQIASIYERQKMDQEAAKTYLRLLNQVPGDPNICSHLAHVHERLDDESSAHHWQSEAHRFHPVSVGVISWLGVWYVKRELYEEAIQFFQMAAAVQPAEAKWRLMVTSCYRRLGDSYKALELYERIAEDHPENVEALQYLEALCRDLGKPHEEYARRLEKLKRYQGQQQQQQQQQQQGQATNAAVATGRQQPQRSQRPERSERPAANSNSNSNNNNNGKENSSRVLDDFGDNKRSPMAAPRTIANSSSSSSSNGVGGRKKPQDDEDDFGGHDVANLLF